MPPPREYHRILTKKPSFQAPAAPRGARLPQDEADIGSLAADIISILIRAEKPGKALSLRLNDKVGSGYRRLVRAARRASSQDARGDTPGEP